MQITLLPEEKQALEGQHKKERDGRIRDRIKAVLLHVEGWQQVHIAQALRIRAETVHEHLEEFVQTKKLKPENGGSQGHLNTQQTTELIQHLEAHTYRRVADICAHVQAIYAVTYSVAGMTHWLHAHRFSYKKPKRTPAKADL